METSTKWLIGLGVLGVILLSVRPTLAITLQGTPQTPVPLPPNPGGMASIPASSNSVSRTAAPIAGAASPPAGAKAIFVSLQTTTAAVSTTGSGDVPAGTLVAGVKVTTPNGNVSTVYPVLWVSPDATRIAIQYKDQGAGLADAVLIASSS